MFMNRVHEQCPKNLTQENTKSNRAKNGRVHQVHSLGQSRRPDRAPSAQAMPRPRAPRAHACCARACRPAACAPCSAAPRALPRLRPLARPPALREPACAPRARYAPRPASCSSCPGAHARPSTHACTCCAPSAPQSLLLASRVAATVAVLQYNTA